ncbi:MAG: hypothetical protein ACU0C9_11515 [Paracoccaceae bacterium]
MAHSPVSGTLGLDFGTANSATGICVDGNLLILKIVPGQKTNPT